MGRRMLKGRKITLEEERLALLISWINFPIQTPGDFVMAYRRLRKIDDMVRPEPRLPTHQAPSMDALLTSACYYPGTFEEFCDLIGSRGWEYALSQTSEENPYREEV